MIRIQKLKVGDKIWYLDTISINKALSLFGEMKYLGAKFTVYEFNTDNNYLKGEKGMDLWTFGAIAGSGGVLTLFNTLVVLFSFSLLQIIFIIFIETILIIVIAYFYLKSENAKLKQLKEKADEIHTIKVKAGKIGYYPLSLLNNLIIFGVFVVVYALINILLREYIFEALGYILFFIPMLVLLAYTYICYYTRPSFSKYYIDDKLVEEEVKRITV